MTSIGSYPPLPSATHLFCQLKVILNAFCENQYLSHQKKAKGLNTTSAFIQLATAIRADCF